MTTVPGLCEVPEYMQKRKNENYKVAPLRNGPRRSFLLFYLHDFVFPEFLLVIFEFIDINDHSIGDYQILKKNLNSI